LGHLQSFRFSFGEYFESLSIFDFSKLQVEAVRELCLNYLTANIDLDNCMSIKQLAYETSSVELSLAADQFVLKHFDSLYDNPELGVYEPKDLLLFLRDDYLCVRREFNVRVFEAFNFYTIF
jgi:hypothetical protein